MKYPNECPVFRTPWGVFVGRPAIEWDDKRVCDLQDGAIIFSVGTHDYNRSINVADGPPIVPLTPAARRVLRVAKQGTR